MKKESRRIRLNRETVRWLENGGRAAALVVRPVFQETAEDSCDVGSCANPDRCCSGEGTTCMT